MSKHTHIRLDLLRDSFPDRPEIGPALSRVLMDEVAKGLRPATCRISHPGRVVAFGRRDTVSRNYPDAVKAAADMGFVSMERIAGGRAALCSEGVINISLATPEISVAEGTNNRFEHISALIAASLRELGVDARIGEVPGEYCPGTHSVNADGEVKLAGVAQRLIQGCAHVGVVLVVKDSQLVRRVLTPVYRSLELEWEPASSGAVEDAVPGISLDQVEESILSQLGKFFDIEPVDLDRDTLAKATTAAPGFRSPQ